MMERKTKPSSTESASQMWRSLLGLTAGLLLLVALALLMVYVGSLFK